MRLLAVFTGAMVAAMSATTVLAVDISTKEGKRIQEAATVLSEIHAVPDKDVPQELWDRAECVIVFPSVKKFAIGVGGSYGRGAMVCRTGADFDGPWSAPAMMASATAASGVPRGTTTATGMPPRAP